MNANCQRSAEWLKANPPACRDEHGGVYPLWEMVRDDGSLQVIRFTRQERFCPHCPRAPYRGENGCIFRYAGEVLPPEPFEIKRYTSKPYISDEAIAEAVGRMLLERGDLRCSYFDAKREQGLVSYNTIKARLGGIEAARAVAEEWIRENAAHHT